VERISQVFARNGVLGGFIHGLGPQPCAEDNDVAAVLANHTNKRLVVWLDLSRPALLHGFVESLEKDVREMPKLPGHEVKKRTGLLLMLICIMIMPVDDDVDALLNCGFHDFNNLLCFLFWIFQVATHFNTHGGTQN